MREHRRRSILAAVAAVTLAGAVNQVVYDNALRNGWQDWSWATHKTPRWE
ncbi:MAG TPA: hypothetical protein VIW92_12425 [Thermoanaerobaculia bacterium]